MPMHLCMAASLRESSLSCSSCSIHACPTYYHLLYLLTTTQVKQIAKERAPFPIARVGELF